MKRRFGLSGQDEHPADSGDQAYDDEGPRIQRTPVFNCNGDRVKQLGYDEQQKGLVEDCKHDRWRLYGVAKTTAICRMVWMISATPSAVRSTATTT